MNKTIQKPSLRDENQNEEVTTASSSTAKQEGSTRPNRLKNTPPLQKNSSRTQKDNTKDRVPKAQVDPSTTPTTNPKKDPLADDDFLKLDIPPLVSVRKQRKHQIDFTQYINLINSTYQAMKLQHSAFSQSVSKSLWTYYCISLLWRRLKLVTERSSPNNDDVKRIDELIGKWEIPDEIGLYLDGIGDFTDVDGRITQLELQAALGSTTIDDLTGHFGRVAAETHYMYETLPAPSVIIQRIGQDVLKTVTGSTVTAWDLSANLRPAVVASGVALHINENCLGYAPRVSLTAEQLYAINEGGIYVEDNAIVYGQHVVIGGLPIFDELIKHVADKLREQPLASKANYVASNSRYGSIAQMGFQKREPGDEGVGQLFKPIRQRLSQLYIKTQLSSNLCAAATVFRYRIKRVSPKAGDSLCYLTATGEAPAATWSANADRVYASTGIWNHDEFRCVSTDPEYVARSYVHRHRNLPP